MVGHSAWGMCLNKGMNESSCKSYYYLNVNIKSEHVFIISLVIIWDKCGFDLVNVRARFACTIMWMYSLNSKRTN